MDTVLHRVEALAGDGRYAVTFRRTDGGEQTAVAQVGAAGVQLAESALPPGWSIDSDAGRATVEVVSALHAARSHADAGAALRDVDGGWDVGLGNVVLGAGGVPECTAHGPMTVDASDAALWECGECGARALLG